ncbi:MAG: invasion associated locus B family protein [Alphaproteobacteria bacterium]|nr:invasion associated locus B family protein [Alphaproteobacteria bacterium]MDP6811640.1 invasion associated locus B family protein [Alphaproteobacteria bacterium]
MIRPFTLLAAALVFCAAGAAQAQKPKMLLKGAEIWGAFSVKEKGGLACYMAGQPLATAPKGVKRDPIWLLVTHRPHKKIRNEVSVYAGYPFKPRAAVTIDVDGKTFELYTVDDTAWVEDPKTEAAIVKAMRAGRKMVVRGLSKRGTKTTDTYSLKGFTKAHQAINKACKVK